MKREQRVHVDDLKEYITRLPKTEYEQWMARQQGGVSLIDLTCPGGGGVIGLGHLVFGRIFGCFVGISLGLLYILKCILWFVSIILGLLRMPMLLGGLASNLVIDL